MQFSISAKLNILLVSTVFALSLYLYFILKDVGRFEKTLTKGLLEVKEEIEKIKHTSGTSMDLNLNNPCPAILPPSVSKPTVPVSGSGSMSGSVSIVSANVLDPLLEVDADADADADADDVSILSNEIKNIIQNIQGDSEEEDEVVEEVNTDPAVEAVVHVEVVQKETEKEKEEIKAEVSADLSKEELTEFTNQELREFLKSRGQSVQGSKDVLIQRIKAAPL